MGYKLCIAEKPSVAGDIAKVIGANYKREGYWEGSGYRVTYAVGHLVGLAEPEAYGYVRQTDTWGDDEALKKLAYDQLPLFPDEFKLVVLNATKDQYKVVESLMTDPQCEEIIDCGDMGPEGHILQWLIRQKVFAKTNGVPTVPVRRLCLTTMEETAIRRAMENLRPMEDFDRIIKGEFCKKKADWVLGMSMSRAASMKYNASIDVGRVLSPTLWFVVMRYNEVRKFKVTDYFTMEAKMEGGFSVFWNKDNGKPEMFFDDDAKDSEGRVLREEPVKARCAEIQSAGYGRVVQLVKAEKATNRPQLYDIIELQKEANRKYGYSAAQTLATAQALYETQKILSYPRTDSRYITKDLEAPLLERIKGLMNQKKYAVEAAALLERGLNIDKRIVDDSKVTDHHALIVTTKMDNFDIDSMQPTKEEAKKGVTAVSMRNILDMVITNMIVALSQSYVYEQTSVAIQFPNKMVFTASGNVPKELGWKGVKERLSGKDTVDAAEEADKEQFFPVLNKGDKVLLKACTPIAKKTTPPKLHTEATLLTAMQNAGSGLGEDGKILQGKGIGTQATRAEIIEKLFRKKFCETTGGGKVSYIQPTVKGMNVIRILPADLYSPAITADWEAKIAKIVDGEMSPEQFLDIFKGFITKRVAELKAQDSEVSFKFEKPSVGECPWCGSDLYRYQKRGVRGTPGFISHYCSNRECDFGIKTTDISKFTGKSLTETQLKTLIADGVVTIKGKNKYGKPVHYVVKYSASTGKNGKTYSNAVATIVQD